MTRLSKRGPAGACRAMISAVERSSAVGFIARRAGPSPTTTIRISRHRRRETSVRHNEETSLHAQRRSRAFLPSPLGGLGLLVDQAFGEFGEVGVRFLLLRQSGVEQFHGLR